MNNFIPKKIQSSVIRGLIHFASTKKENALYDYTKLVITDMSNIMHNYSPLYLLVKYAS